MILHLVTLAELIAPILDVKDSRLKDELPVLLSIYPTTPSTVCHI